MTQYKYYILLFLFFNSLVFAGVQNDPYATVLKEKHGWVIDSIAPGFIRYNYFGYYEQQQAFQNINVLELDLSLPDYSVEILFTDISRPDSLSGVAEKNDAFAGINGTYESDASFVKSGGIIHTQNQLPADHLRFWKHEGALFYDKETNEIAITYGDDQKYQSSKIADIISGSPMLIDNYNPVGIYFTGDVSDLVLDSLEYEDYRRHQGVRHPRTAVAQTRNNRLLLITVDGRHKQAAGMSAKELTEFIRRYFDPKSALNIDGGGSTTMWIKESNNENGVVNFPSDNKIFDHFGQRRVASFLLLKKK